MVLELTGDGTLDGPVARIVRSHSQLIDKDLLSRVEHLHGQHAGHVQRPCDVKRDPLRVHRPVRIQARSRRDDLAADSFGLNGPHNGISGGLTTRGARYLRR